MGVCKPNATATSPRQRRIPLDRTNVFPQHSRIGKFPITYIPYSTELTALCAGKQGNCLYSHLSLRFINYHILYVCVCVFFMLCAEQKHILKNRKNGITNYSPSIEVASKNIRLHLVYKYFLCMWIKVHSIRTGNGQRHHQRSVKLCW